MRLYALPLLAVSLAACAASTQEKVQDLRKSVSDYNYAFRWKNYQHAAAFLPADVRASFISNYEEDDKELNVEGFQIIGVNMKTPEVAEVTVRYQFMELPSVILEKRVVKQHWAVVNGQWLLEHEDKSIRPLASDEEEEEEDIRDTPKEGAEHRFGGYKTSDSDE